MDVLSVETTSILNGYYWFAWQALQILEDDWILSI